MDPALRDTWKHMRDLGLGALAHANRHAAYAAMENPRWPDLSVLQAAHAAELLIKARIAEEHPLLIFKQLPKPSDESSPLDVEALFANGRTVQWSELPDRLWAATGIRLPNLELYREVGSVRNGLQHFGAGASRSPSTLTLRFNFEIVDAFINDCWGLFAVDYDEDYERYVYFVSALIDREIYFNVSPNAADKFRHWDADWNGVCEEYAREMIRRVATAGGDTSTAPGHLR